MSASARTGVSAAHSINLVEWLARHFSRPFSAAAVKRQVPANFDEDAWHSLPDMLSAIGLKSQTGKKSLANIDPVILPCVLKTKQNELIVLTEITPDGKHCVIIGFEPEPEKKKVSTSSLGKTLEPAILMVSVDPDILGSRKDVSAGRPDTGYRHWFWQPVHEHWSSWVQIFVAALGSNILGLALPIFVMNVYDRVIPSLAMVTLWTLAAGVIIALLLDLLLKLLRANVLERAGRRIDLKVAASLFRHAMNIRLLERRGGAATIASQIRDFEAVRDFFTSGSFVAIIDLMFIGIFVAVLWVIVGPIAIVPLLAVPIVILLAFIAQIPIGASIERLQQLSGKKQLVLVETLLGIETVKSLNGERVMQQEWENAVAASSHINARTKFWSNFAMNGTMLVQQGVSVIIILWGVYLVADGQISIGGLIAANILAGRVLAPLGNISQTLVRAQQALRSMSMIADYMKLPSESPDVVGSELTVQSGAIKLTNVSLTYPGAQVRALSDFSLEIRPGEAIGVLGRVGSGKTTLGKMLAGLIRPDEGIVLVDGHEISQYETASLREAIGYLPQDPDMFTGTILENLLIGRPDATEDEINRALYFSGMDYFIQQNPEGLKQFVGEKGNRLSGGQRQAISLARLLLRQPKVLFLDEPTNAMDHATEAIVTKRLKELGNDGTTLIISTHRHSLTDILDRLVVIDQGKKVMDGPKNDILKQLSRKG